jgi:formylglycine-generating enzyme required for sulfatase activity
MKTDLGHSFSVPDLQLPGRAKELIMLWIPPGTFMMGSPENEPGHAYEDALPFEAALSRGFWLGQYEVTQAQWQAVMHNNPSHFQSDGLNRPVETVSWHDALAFCNQLTQRLDNALRAGYRFSLPTQMQWEYACRAGTQTLYHSGDSDADLLRVAWCAENSDGQTHPVGDKEPNAWGLYDMHGNVGEWCYDAAEDYPEGQVTDWIGNGDGSCRSLRGAAWGSSCHPGNFGVSRSACAEPETKRAWIGFRLCLRGHGMTA